MKTLGLRSGASAATDGRNNRGAAGCRRRARWKIEGLEKREDCERIVAAARREGRNRVGCIILGRGEDHRKVREWLTPASGAPGFIGFAVGRTSFWGPLVDWRGKKITRDAAVAEIAGRYQEFVEIFKTSEKVVPV